MSFAPWLLWQLYSTQAQGQGVNGEVSNSLPYHDGLEMVQLWLHTIVRVSELALMTEMVTWNVATVVVSSLIDGPPAQDGGELN